MRSGRQELSGQKLAVCSDVYFWPILSDIVLNHEEEHVRVCCWFVWTLSDIVLSPRA